MFTRTSLVLGVAALSIALYTQTTASHAGRLARGDAAGTSAQSIGDGTSASPEPRSGDHEPCEASLPRIYADDFTGWPVSPVHRQHPVRGSFLDPRTGGYHNGVDVSVRDNRPERDAPPGRTHRVYAIEGGPVWRVIKPTRPDAEGIVRVGHFGYGHVDPVVEQGEIVQAGQMIGWSFRGEWHVHLTEWFYPGGDKAKRIPVNPLCPGGKLAPYVDTKPPVISGFRFFRPASERWRVVQGRAVFSGVSSELAPTSLSGLVDVRVRIEDPQSFLGWFDAVEKLEAHHHPERVELTVMSVADSKVVYSHLVTTSSGALGLDNTPRVPFSSHYAPGTRQNLRAANCMRHGSRSCRGALWFRLFATEDSRYWDTTAIANGFYRLTIIATDVAGNLSERTTVIDVENPA